MQLEGKTILLTGASSGIGAALARELSAHGTRLILAARNEENLEKVRQTCASPASHMIARMDLADPDAAAEIVARIDDETGGIDILVNNAGLSQRSLGLDTLLDVDRALMTVDYLGTVAITKALLPRMIERGRGQIAVVTSVAGKVGTPMRSGYSGAKHALHGFFEALRGELASTPISITMLVPGFVDTGLPLRALTGDGSPQGHGDHANANGMTAEVCARKMRIAIERDRAEATIAGWEGAAVWAWRLCPPLFRWAISRMKVT